MYVLGDLSASVIKFDSTQGIWSWVAPMPEARAALAACAVGSDIFVFGGLDADTGGFQDLAFKYDTVANDWSILAPMPSACSSNSASVLDGLIYIVGAGDENCEVLRLDPISGAWSMFAPTSHRRRSGASFVVSGCLYAAGGHSSDRASVERYDVASNSWTAVADMLQVRYACGAVTIASEGPAEEQDLFDSLIEKGQWAPLDSCHPCAVV
jgi:N-acetylneuraminic acid mutarotase